MAYHPRKTVAAEHSFADTEQELLATVEAHHGCHLLSGEQSNLVTHNKTNTLLETHAYTFLMSGTLERLCPHCFHSTWVCRPGRRNVADPLSQIPIVVSLDAMLAVVARSAARQHDTPSSSSSPAAVPAPTEGGHQSAGGKASPASGGNAVSVITRRANHAADTAQLLADAAAPSSFDAAL